MHSLSKIIGIIGDAVIPTTTPHFIRNVFAVGCAILVASAVAGTILWIPYTRRRMSDGALRREKRIQKQTEDAEFDAMFWDEYDAMMTGATATATATATDKLTPVSVSTPRGDVAMVYIPSRSAFGYYTDRRSSVTYTHLETVARKFLLHHALPDLAKLAYADRRLKGLGGLGGLGGQSGDCCESEDAILVSVHTPDPDPVVVPSPIVPVVPVQGIFARLRSYNRKPGSDAAAAAAASTAGDTGDSSAASRAALPLEYTRFVWLGTLHDLSEASKPPADYERVDYDYAEFKRLNAARSSTSAPVSTVSDSAGVNELELDLEPVPIASAAAMTVAVSASSSSSSSSESD